MAAKKKEAPTPVKADGDRPIPDRTVITPPTTTEIETATALAEQGAITSGTRVRLAGVGNHRFLRVPTDEGATTFVVVGSDWTTVRKSDAAKVKKAAGALGLGVETDEGESQ